MRSVVPLEMAKTIALRVAGEECLPPAAAILGAMQPTSEPALAALPALEAVRGRVEGALRGFLAAQREELSAVAVEAAALVDEIARLVDAGGKRLRPAFCYWGHRSAGGEDGDPIVRAAAALELFHTFALVHDDVMDESDERRGVASTHARFAADHAARGLPGDPARHGRSLAVLAGDLAAVLADRLLHDSGFPPERLLGALRRFDRMRVEMAAGQLLDLAGAGEPGRVAALKTGSYTVEGPLLVGAALAGGSPEVVACLSRFGAPLGEAFQVRDDVLDGEPGAEPARVSELVDAACAALDPSLLAGEAAGALRELAEALRLPF